ncbi:MAG: hypothetical protein ACRDE2_06325 [Chitinophagaceae bacterium]
MLDKTTLQASLKAAFEFERNNTTDWDGALDDLCIKISEAIDVYVKGATINYISGLIAPTGAVTGAFEGDIN